MHSSLVPVIVIVVVLALYVVAQAVLNRNSEFQCGQCGETFAISPFVAALTPHRFSQKLATCPHCGARTWVSRVPKDRIPKD
jgi:predicted RNA-binding Zn-ribbon protein involved in translation (DUF1610 family)